MAYSTIDKSSLYQNQVLYVGNATVRSITGVGFQPDLLWIKDRTNANSHMLADAVRGATKFLVVDGTYADNTDSNRISAFDSDGFSIGTNNNVNQSSANDVAWNWKANGTGSANTDGSISSTVSANTASGFSIVSYTGTGVSAKTIGHGLGLVPKMVIVKSLNAVDSWYCYHAGIGNAKSIILNTTGAEYASTNWNNTTPTSSVFSVAYGDTNTSARTYIAYCFAEVAGYSKFGSYTGNANTDGAFIYTGFKPSLIIIKGTDTAYAENWFIFDNKRPGYNFNANLLNPNSSTTETTTGSNGIDILSNGFKMRSTDNGTNRSTDTYIYAAFGQPIISNSGVCATAR
jgi:hypothetical protein